MIKKQLLFALLLLLLIPAVTVGAGILFSLINPEIAAGHPNYARNWHLLNALKLGVMYGSFVVILALYLLGCLLVVRSKEQSRSWLALAPFGPLGFAILSVLNDRAPSQTDRYSHFVRRLNAWLRIGYEWSASLSSGNSMADHGPQAQPDDLVSVRHHRRLNRADNRRSGRVLRDVGLRRGARGNVLHDSPLPASPHPLQSCRPCHGTAISQSSGCPVLTC